MQLLILMQFLRSITNECTFHRAPSENGRHGWKNRVALISYVLQVLHFSFANILSNLSRDYKYDYNKFNNKRDVDFFFYN